MYWKMRPGRARDAARAKWEQDHPPWQTSTRGPRPDEVEHVDDALIARGHRYALADHGGSRLLCQTLANAACPPLPPGCEIVFTKRAIVVDGIPFERNAPALFTRLAYENLTRARKDQQTTEDSGPPVST